MSDSLELESLFSHSNISGDEGMYEKVEFIQLSDQQGGNYSTGQISFLTDMAMKNHVVYSDSYLQLPIKVSFTKPVAAITGPPAIPAVPAGDGKIAVKNSILSLIQGVSIESGGGTVIANEQMSTPIINNLKLLIDSSIDFIEGNELHYFGKDVSSVEDVSGADFSVIGGAKPSVSSGIPGINAYKNPALANRIVVFSNRASGIVSNDQYFVAIIPLKFIHDFFKQMDFPIVNMSLRIGFNVAGTGSYKNYQPFVCPTFPAHSTLGSAATPVAIAAGASIPLSTAGTTAVISDAVVVPTWTSRFGATYTPKLFLKTVYFRAKEAQMLKDSIVKGYTKRLVYTSSNYYPTTVTQSQINFPVVQGVIRPVRMWVLPLATGTLASAANSFPSSIGKYILKSTNIQLNGNNFYQNEFKTPYQFYKEFKSQCIGASVSTACGAPIGFNDWLNGINPYVFDLSRNPTVRSNNQCSLTLVSDVAEAGAVGTAAIGAPTLPLDLVVIVERLMTCDLKISEAGIECLVKQGADI